MEPRGGSAHGPICPRAGTEGRRYFLFPILRLCIGNAAILGCAGEGFAPLGRNLEIRGALVITDVAPDRRDFFVGNCLGLGPHFQRLGFFDAYITIIAGLRIAFRFCHVEVGFGRCDCRLEA